MSQVVFGNHFEKEVWNLYMDKVVADAGICPGCDQVVKGRRGWRKARVMQEHLFQECKDYPYSKQYLNKKN